MSNIELVIKIDEKLNERIKFLEPHGETMLDNLLRAIQHGTPLEEHCDSCVFYHEESEE